MDFVGIHYIVHYYYTVEISYSYLGCYVPVKLLILYLHLQQVSQVIILGLFLQQNYNCKNTCTCKNIKKMCTWKKIYAKKICTCPPPGRWLAFSKDPILDLLVQLSFLLSIGLSPPDITTIRFTILRKPQDIKTKIMIIIFLSFPPLLILIVRSSHLLAHTSGWTPLSEEQLGSLSNQAFGWVSGPGFWCKWIFCIEYPLHQKHKQDTMRPVPLQACGWRLQESQFWKR